MDNQDRKAAQSLGKKPSIQQRNGEWGYLHPFNATWNGGFTTRALARDARNAVKGAEQEVENENGDIAIVSRAPVPDPELEEWEMPLPAEPKPEPPPVVAAPKPNGKWKPTQADVLEVRRLRALGHSFRKVDEDMGWPPANGNRSFRITKDSWNFDDLEK